jgi:acetyltransferase-like isoleucine patch superfamily enzyme
MMKKLIQFIKKYDFPIHLFVGWTIVCVKASTLFHTAMTKFKLKALGCPVGKGFKIDGKLWIWAQKKGCIRLGDNVKINSRFGSNLVGLINPAVFQCLDGGTITIGNNSGLSSPVLSSRSSITIGERTLIGGNVRIFDHDYHSLDYTKRCGKETAGDVKTRPVSIGNNVFIGTNAIILKGVTIGSRAIIGAGSVVSCDVPADEIWAGNPARCVRGAKRDS